METDNMFQLKNHRYIMDENISHKMFIIKQTAPENNYQNDSIGYSWDESGMAELFCKCYENDTRYCPEAKSWYTYDGGVWKKDVGALLVAEKIKEFTRLMSLYCGEIADDEIRKRYMSFVSKMGDRRFRDRIMKDAASVNPISATVFDSNPYIINCLNGTYNLETMTFKEHDWRDFLTMQTNFSYTQRTDINCPRWEQFIDEITEGNKEKAEYLQKALGYSMIGIANEECMFILHGKTTRNGKSTMLSAIQHLLGDYASVSPVSIICNSGIKNAEAANPMLASLKGKRFVTMAESNQYGKLDEETIKQLTGGEEIKARNLYETAMTFVPQFTLWLSCNDLPAVNDKSLFASNRVRVIEFNKHFGQKEQDKSLKNKFQKDEAMQGIFAWLIAGYFKYKRFGLNMTEEMANVIKQYEKDNDLVLQFLEDKCVTTDGRSTRIKVMYDNYKIWCKSNGYYVSNCKKFVAQLLQHPEWHSGKDTENGYPVIKNLSLKGI